MKEQGIVISVKNGVSIKKINKKFPSMPTKDFVHLKAHFRRLEQHAREQLQKAFQHGIDPEYIIKTEVKEPRFEWQNGLLVFVPDKKKSHKGDVQT